MRTDEIHRLVRTIITPVLPAVAVIAIDDKECALEALILNSKSRTSRETTLAVPLVSKSFSFADLKIRRRYRRRGQAHAGADCWADNRGWHRNAPVLFNAVGIPSDEITAVSQAWILQGLSNEAQCLTGENKRM